MRSRGLQKQRAQRRHLRSKQQATTLGTGQFVSGRRHMVVPVESRVKGCQHRAPKVRKSGSRACRQAKCVSKLQRQQAHICLEIKQPTSWLELPPSLGGAGGLDAAPAAERLLLQACETLCSGRTGARRRSTAAETLSNVGAASSSRRPGRHCKKHATSKPSIDPHVALLEVAAARTGAKCQQDFSTKHEQVRRRRQRPQSHRCRF